MVKKRQKSRSGFTLIEILLVLAIISILVGFVLTALSPTEQLGKARDTKRRNDVTSILNAIYQYQIDTNQLPPGLPSGTARQICRSDAVSCNNGVNLTVLTLSGTYLNALPVDPQLLTSGTGTNYWIVRDANSRLTVTAPGAEQAEGGIGVTR